MKMSIAGAAPIEHPDAYARAVRFNIKANARVTLLKREPRLQEIEDALDAGRIYNDDGRVVGYHEGFIAEMAKAYDKWFKLSEGQCAAILRGIDARAARRAEWLDKQAALNASLQHVGTAGKREEFTLTLKKVVTIETDYGTLVINILEDAQLNVVIYKGNAGGFSEWNEGETRVIKATVKEHGVRNAIKQTVISRPAFVSAVEVAA
jgi:hypothetical protein